MTILETKILKKYYGKGENLVKAVDEIDLQVNKGEFVSIIGKSGSGKSTMLHLLGGLDRPSNGKVLIDGKDIFSMDDDELAIFRRREIGFIFQSFNLIPVLNVWENIVLPIGLDNQVVDEEYVNEIIKMLGLEHKKDTLVSNLSGGQQQRVAIARALASKPSIILADEPTGNLDSQTGNEVLTLLKNSIKKYNQTLVMITHDNSVAQMADRTVRIEDGKITQNSIKKAVI
ncbi:ABC transporter ATP-binding protein [Oceanirhabdus sp. W0125-5]|uniref:ABC transporter ATP-binding protein n=1 Tax=Oceanirhabdus sp. W0125-5 TaxID=2999116 RepID=UPI0022F2B5C0|nr:ABC transporter ATP-binding protein [Oceanirhabdus sp. W0125-5]WBW99708.1 ABC transporter ATP-binding protein [Oceanirhabdus sp. W0125-5]